MRVLLVHNAYQQRGGEDEVFDTESLLLARRGDTIATYVVDNRDVLAKSRLRLGAETVWSSRSKRALRARTQEFRPDVAHFHNTFPLISPAAYSACRAEGASVVQTLHNYRLMCPNGLFFRDGRVCEDCLGKTPPWPGVLHACYRNSRPATGVVAAMLTTHRALRTWTEQVDMYIALTSFAKRKFIEGGLPASKIAVKPNFVYPDPGIGEGRGQFALFVGRLSPEKGLTTLLAAWERIQARMPLKIVGTGPMASEVAQRARELSGVELLGRLPMNEVHELMGLARVLVFCSEWHETFGRVVIESFARGTPVIASCTGAVAELVDHGRTGLLFSTGDPESLVAQVESVIRHPAQVARMRREARAEFEARYTAERNYGMLREIYERANERRKSS